MNPVASTISSTDFPPMSEVRKSLKINWYRCPIDKQVLSQLVKKSDMKGLFQSLGHLGLWVLTGSLSWAMFTLGSWWGFLMALFLHGTVASYFTAPNHELCHRTVFNSPWLNEFFLRVFGLFGWNRLTCLVGISPGVLFRQCAGSLE